MRLLYPLSVLSINQIDATPQEAEPIFEGCLSSILKHSLFIFLAFLRSIFRTPTSVISSQSSCNASSFQSYAFHPIHSQLVLFTALATRFASITAHPSRPTLTLSDLLTFLSSLVTLSPPSPQLLSRPKSPTCHGCRPYIGFPRCALHALLRKHFIFRGCKLSSSESRVYNEKPIRLPCLLVPMQYGANCVDYPVFIFYTIFLFHLPF